MNIQITARHFNGSPVLYAKLKESIERLARFNDSITAAHVILDIQKNGTRRAEVVLNILDKSICAQAEEEFMHKAIEIMIERAGRQLKREKQKLKVHKSVPVSELVTE